MYTYMQIVYVCTVVHMSASDITVIIKHISQQRGLEITAISYKMVIYLFKGNLIYIFIKIMYV